MNPHQMCLPHSNMRSSWCALAVGLQQWEVLCKKFFLGLPKAPKTVPFRRFLATVKQYVLSGNMGRHHVASCE